MKANKKKIETIAHYLGWVRGKKFGKGHLPWWRLKTKKANQDGRAAPPDWDPFNSYQDAQILIKIAELNDFKLAVTLSDGSWRGLLADPRIKKVHGMIGYSFQQVIAELFLLLALDK